MPRVGGALCAVIQIHCHGAASMAATGARRPSGCGSGEQLLVQYTYTAVYDLLRLTDSD